MYLSISDSPLTGHTEQTLRWQFDSSTRRGVPIQEIFLQTTHMPGWIHPVYKMSSMGLPKRPIFRSPWKGRACWKACAYLSQSKCLLWSQSSFLILYWSGKLGVRNIKLLILPQTLCMTLSLLSTHLPICTMAMHLAWMWPEHAMAYLMFLSTAKSVCEKCQTSTLLVIPNNCRILVSHKNLSTSCQRLLKHNSPICSLFDYLCLNKAWRNTINV